MQGRFVSNTPYGQHPVLTLQFRRHSNGRQGLGDGLANVLRARLAAQIGGAGPATLGVQDRLDRGQHRIVRGAVTQEVQHHRATPNLTNGVGNALTRAFSRPAERSAARIAEMHALDAARDAQATRIFIGSENRLFSLSGSSVIASPWRNGDGQVVGVVGVIGPTRLNYARVIPMVDYTAKAIGRLLT